MRKSVEQILAKMGPCLSTDLAATLVKEHGLTPAAARQRISRADGNVRRQSHLIFPRGVRFLYHKKDYGSPYYWTRLISALLKSNTAYGLALAAIHQRGDICPLQHYHISCGAPIRQKKHLSSQLVLERLKEAKLVEEIEVPGIGQCVALTQGGGDFWGGYEDLSARLICEAILLNAIKGWARSLAVCSFELVKLRSDPPPFPTVSTFHWDLAAPSYLGALVEMQPEGKPKPGFFVCDLLLGSPVSVDGLKPFIHKCRTLRGLKKVGKCLQVFVAEDYSKEAFRLARESGIIPATPETLFGSEVANALRELAGILRTAASHASPEKFNELFNRLGKIEGAATNLRGALFEFIAADIVRKTMPGNVQIEMNRIFKSSTNGKAEVDVMAVIPRRAVHFIECKGYQPDGYVADSEVVKWLDSRIPIVRGEAKSHPELRNLDHHFEFWTTGKLSLEALEKIRIAKGETRRFTIEYKDADGLDDLVRETNDPNLMQVLRDHFLNHPLATVENAVEREMRRAKRKEERATEVLLLSKAAAEDFPDGGECPF